jgi:hypothetical protein
MVTVNGLTDPYTHQGELHFSDEAGHPIVILCYAQKCPVLGHKDFVIMSNSSIVSIMRCDIQYHAESSGTIGAAPLRRLSTEPYHYTDTIDKNPKSGSAASKNPVTRELINATHESGCKCQPIFTPLLSDVDFLRMTGRRIRKSPKGRCNPKKDRQKLKVTRFPCLMSEIKLQQLLQRTSSSNEKEGDMDMTVKDGVRMSKFDIRAIKIGSKVSAQMKTDVNNFNSKYVGKDSVFPLKTEHHVY